LLGSTVDAGDADIVISNVHGHVGSRCNSLVNAGVPEVLPGIISVPGIDASTTFLREGTLSAFLGAVTER